MLRLNAAAGAGVSTLDRPELLRLMGISALHMAARRSDGALAGYALAFSNEDTYDAEEFLALQSSIAEPFVYVDQVAIDEHLRRKGIGRMLYQELAARARGLGAAILCCEVNVSPPNPGSLAFHRRLGFTQAGELNTVDGRTVALLRREA